ncbi:MAG: hypothetical protein ACLVL2_24075 [Bacteroides cellulosilyticus]
MSEELQKNPSSQEEEIDLLELALKVWGERKFILKACGYAVLIRGAEALKPLSSLNLSNT